MRYRVRVNLTTPEKSKEPLLANRVRRLPGKLVRLLFGDATEILVLKPGQTVDTVEFHELPDAKNNK